MCKENPAAFGRIILPHRASSTALVPEILFDIVGNICLGLRVLVLTGLTYEA